MESFYLELTGNPTGASIARAFTRISIVDNDAVVTTPDIYASDLTVDETAGTVAVPVMLGKVHGQALHHPRHRRLHRGHHSPATPPPPDPTTPPPPAPSPSPPANR